MIFSLQSMMVPLPIMSPYPHLLVRPHLPPLPLLWVVGRQVLEVLHTHGRLMRVVYLTVARRVTFRPMGGK